MTDPTQIAELISRNLEKAYEGSDPICASDLALIATKLGVGFHEIYVGPGAGENLRISVPVTVPIRNVPMGQRAQ